jgi:broad specificity phosphatase PhoE
MAVVYLIRHGQASFGLKDYDKLSELGEQQSRVLGESLRERVAKVDLVVTGAMQRHKETAEIALEAMGCPLVPRVDERWNEYDHQEVIVKHKPAYKSRTVMAADLGRQRDTRHAFQVMFDAALARWTGGEYDDDYAEPWDAFVDRANAGVSAVHDESADAKNVLVFTSGGPISAVVARLLGLGVEGWLQLNRVMVNAGETKIVSGRSGTSVVTYNGHAHFESDRRLLTYR